MASRIVKISYPSESANGVWSCISEIEISDNVRTVYGTVSSFEKNICPQIKRRLTQLKTHS
jgi:hypothetical protein